MVSIFYDTFGLEPLLTINVNFLILIPLAIQRETITLMLYCKAQNPPAWI
jgi:hypothetical protein